jgi:hypothetical protein
MKTAERVALIYGVSVAGAAAVSFLRGRRGGELASDAALHGAVLGTGLNLVGWLASNSEDSWEVEEIGPETAAVQNHGEPPNYSTTGVLSDDAVTYLMELDADGLYAPMRTGGVKIDALPQNPSLIAQDAT